MMSESLVYWGFTVFTVVSKISAMSRSVETQTHPQKDTGHVYSHNRSVAGVWVASSQLQCSCVVINETNSVQTRW